MVAAWELHAPTVSVTADTLTPSEGSEATLTATAFHDAADLVSYTYQWYKDGELLTDATENTLAVSVDGSYTVKVRASDGSRESEETESDPVVITVVKTPTTEPTTPPSDQDQTPGQGQTSEQNQTSGQDLTAAQDQTAENAVPGTGENRNLALWLLMALVAATAMLSITWKCKKKRGSFQ